MTKRPEAGSGYFGRRMSLLASALAVVVMLGWAGLTRPIAIRVRADETRSRGRGPAPDAADDDERAYRRALGRVAMEENCLICHSEEMITGQQLTGVQWKAEIDKMTGWGAPLRSDQVEVLLDFLVIPSPGSASPAPPRRLTLEKALLLFKPQSARLQVSRGALDRGAALYAMHCATCHGQDGQGADLGPNVVGTPALMRQVEFMELLRTGRRRMPGFQSVLSGAQAVELLAWLQTREYRPRLPR